MAKIIGSTKITTRYQITLPEEVRRSLGLEIGQMLTFVQSDDGCIELVTDWDI